MQKPQLDLDTLGICDIHIHVGHFRGLYFTPQDIVDAMRFLRVKRWAVSSTSTCAYVGGYDMACNELKKIIELAPYEAIPILWLTPDMIIESPDLCKYKEIQYRMLKVHGFSHDWHASDNLLEKVFIVAQNRNLPVLIHTGGRPESNAGRYAAISKNHPNVTVVLAHGRPIDETIMVMKQCQNVLVDTAFMPIEDMHELIKAKLETRIVFGSDYPLDSYFDPENSALNRYSERIKKLGNIFGEDLLSIWAAHNFAAIFK